MLSIIALVSGGKVVLLNELVQLSEIRITLLKLFILGLVMNCWVIVCYHFLGRVIDGKHSVIIDNHKKTTST